MSNENPSSRSRQTLDEQQDVQTLASSSTKLNPILTLLIVFAVCSVVLTLGYVASHQQSLALREPYRQPSSAPQVERVAGAGIVEATSRNVSIGAYTSGVVAEVPVIPGQRMKKGDVLLRLDSRAAEAAVAFQESALKVAESQLAEQLALPRPEDIPISQATVNAAGAALDQATKTLARYRMLIKESAVSVQDLEAAVEAELVAKANLASAQTTLDKLMAGAWKADLAITEAQVAQAQAALQQAMTNLTLQSVTAPFDGDVLQVNVRPGELVTQFAAVALMIFGDTSRLNVRVDIDEVDIPRFTSAKSALAYRRGDAETAIKLTLLRVDPIVIPKQTLTGESQERIDTRVLQAIFKVELSPDSPVLFVGQQLDVFAPLEIANSL